MRAEATGAEQRECHAMWPLGVRHARLRGGEFCPRVDDALRRAVGLDSLHIPHPAEVESAWAVAIGLLDLDQNTLEHHCPVVRVMHCGLDFEALYLLGADDGDRAVDAGDVRAARDEEHQP